MCFCVLYIQPLVCPQGRRRTECAMIIIYIVYNMSGQHFRTTVGGATAAMTITGGAIYTDYDAMPMAA